jgi:hypothetical protein
VTHLRGGISGIGMRKPRITRDWTAAREKCDIEQGCRVCGAWPVEAAHVVGRTHDGDFPLRNEDWSPFDVAPDRIVPLCADHHRAYDAHRFDLLPFLTIAEQAQAVSDAQGISAALNRTMPSESPKRVAV